MTANEFWGAFIATVNYFVFGYFIIVNTMYLFLFSAAFVSARRYVRRRGTTDLHEIFRSPLTPKISVIIPAYNEAASIVEVVRAALHLQYPRYEVVVVNDGSEDETLARLVDSYDLKNVVKAVELEVPSSESRGVYISTIHDNLVVVDKVHAGKPDTLNAGINVASGDILCFVDADTLIDPDALLEIARPFLERPGETVAAGGVVRIVNGCEVSGGRVTAVHLPKGVWANVQIIEYLRAFLGGRLGWAALGALLIVPGAFGAFERSTLVQVGGYKAGTVGEDMEIVLRLHSRLRLERRPYRIVFIPDQVCWTPAPEHYKDIARQRDRWQRGLIESMRSYEWMMLHPAYGTVGMMSLPFYFLFEMLGPVIELGGYAMIALALSLGVLRIDFLYLFLTVAVLYGIIVSFFGIALDAVARGRLPRLRSLLKMGLYAVVDNLGYRQLNTWWRTWAYVTYRTGPLTWGSAARRGYASDSQ